MRGSVVVRLSALALGTALLASCSGDGDADGADATDPPPAQSTVIQPGLPGESNRTLAPSDYPDSTSYNKADVEFVTGMIAHHLQAIEMTELAKTRAEDASVRSLADRISASQGPEIHAMAAWLEVRELPVPEGASGHGGHGGHGGTTAMRDPSHGMLTEEEMEELADADGAAFDRLFLRGMIQHHEGAVAMSDSAQTEGADLMASEMAADIASGQGAEIARMQALLDQVS
ncbi:MULTISPECIES: DUF305 domain-containing protein [Mumia]|uniref:DUF305 domain-containing protein n=1 Tax=Mumia TaxID=1546255 RepID=UPI00141FBA49|nr:DUF305 domain-containing protein [Mumia sp. ZJ1417]QMW66775.1 DUF305 domain-containing protein [Mumia sp. ZJ1417]